MFKRLIGQKHFCGLDLGSQSIKAALIEVDEHREPKLLGVYESKTNGFKNGSVVDLTELSESMHAAIAKLSQKTGVKIKEVQFGISGQLIENRSSAAVLPLMDRGSKVISGRDVKKVQAQARFLAGNIEETILHDFPQHYKVDDANLALNPVGLYGRKLELKTLAIVAKNTIIKNLIKAVNQAGCDVARLFFTSFASARASLNDYQMRQGCLLLDLGSDTTNILIFKNKNLAGLRKICLGGNNITQRIAGELNLSFEIAEDIKQSYAFATVADFRSDEEILIKRDEGYLPIRKEIICLAIEPIIAEWVELIYQTIQSLELCDQINAGIILVGGGSLLPGLAERIERRTNITVKMSKVDIAPRQLHNAPKYAAAVGLAKSGWTPPIVSALPHQGHWGYVVNKIRELYQEYF